MVSVLDKAKRALVVVLRAFAITYGLDLSVTRDSLDKDLSSAYRKLSRRVHPDKNRGNTTDQQKLNVAYNSWEEARKAAEQGRKKAASSATVSTIVVVPKTRAEYRINSVAVLLTYQGFVGVEQWARFVVFVEAKKKTWRVKYWSATLESNVEDGCHVQLGMSLPPRNVCLRAFCDRVQQA